MFADPLVMGLKPQLQGSLLWVALIVTADAVGRAEGDPTVLKHTVLSEFDDKSFPIATIGKLLEQMDAPRKDERGEQRRLLVWYNTGNRRHVELCGWSKNQRLHFPVSERPAPAESPASDFSGEDISTLPPPADSRGPERMRLIRARIKLEMPDCRHNLYALATQLWNRGFENEEQILYALRSVFQNAERIRNPWAYIQSQGLLGSSLSRAVEDSADQLRSDEKRAAKRGMETVAEIMHRAVEQRRKE